MQRFIHVFTILSVLLLAACGVDDARVKDPVKLSQINTELGVAYMNQGDYNTAMDKLQKAVSMDPSNHLAYSSIAMLHARLGQNEDAERNFKRAIEIEPKDSDIHNNYGAFLCKQKRYKDAEQQFKDAIDNPLYRTPEYAYLNAGLCAQDPDEQEKFFRAALRLNPKFAAGLFQMAEFSFQKERYLSARAYLSRYHEVVKPTAASLWLSIKTERKLGDAITARGQAQQLKTQFPDSEETRLLLESNIK